MSDLLTEPQKTEIRRHLGYPEPATALNFPGGPPYSATFGQAGAHIGDRYTEAYYDLEYRLIDLPETGVVAILGANADAFPGYTGPAAANITVATQGASAAVAGTLPLQIGTEAASVSVSVDQTAAQIAAEVVQAILNLTIAPTLVVAIQTGNAVRVESRAVGADMNTFPVRAWGNGDTTFAITDTTASPAPTMTLRGGLTPPGPRWTNPDTNPPQLMYGHLPIIRYWEEQIPNAADGMDTRQAGKFTQERAEYAKRKAAYISACRDMAQTLAVVYFGGKNYRGQSGIRREY